MIPPVGSLDQFGPATVSALVVAAYLVAGEPVVGTVLHRRFEAAERRDRKARRWLYTRLVVLEWGLLAIVAGVLAVAPRVGWSDLGVRSPQWTVVGVVVTVVVCVLLVLTTLAAAEASRPGRHSRAGPLPISPAVLAMLPRTTAERWMFAGVSVTAGVCEELLFRGYLIAVIQAVAPGLPVWLPVLVSSLAFGLAHAYQGRAGIVGTAVIGVIFAVLYALTGSLLVPILLHALVDLRVLVVAVPPASSRKERR